MLMQLVRHVKDEPHFNRFVDSRNQQLCFLRHLDMIDFDVGNRRLKSRRPVDKKISAVNQLRVEQLDKGVVYGSGVGLEEA